MDRFGKWALRIAAAVILSFAAYSIYVWFHSASPEQIHEIKDVAWRTTKLLLVISAVFCLTMLGALGFWASRAGKLEDKTRKEVHDATKE